jgi:DNA mismatch repair ATPase MutS
LLINTYLVLGYVGVLHNAFKRIAMHSELEATCQELLRSLNQLDSQSSLLNEFRSKLCDPTEKNSAVAALVKLRWPIRLAGLRLHPSLYILFLVLQICLLWDFRVFEWIEQWRLRYSREVTKWVASLGQLEAILSAAAIHYEYPSWAFPDFDLPEEVLFEARQVGHPLLGDSSRVCNDLKIDTARPLLLVTGSNMSGKSTLMRAVGVNVALSRIGAPVCAEKFLCPTFDIATSIRVRDSLADGVSFFMAELKRLREVVDVVQHSREQYNRRSLVILDEILQGTNSQERQIAVSHVVQTLLEYQALLLVSTHDLQLADTEGFADNSQIVHFREHFEDRDGQSQMLFDYRMHPGVAPTTNALKLLELVGLSKQRR